MVPEITTGITANRGRHWWRGRLLIMPTFHPAYALRNPEAKTAITEDLLGVRRVLMGVKAAPVPKG